MHQILGQDKAVEILQTALRAGRVHHGWIFAGPRGVGKRTTAVELAKILLDPLAEPDLAGRVAAAPDGETSRLVESGAHPDLHLIRKELALFSADSSLHRRKLMNIPIGVLREHVIGGRVGEQDIDAPAWLTPVRGHGKVFIIDEAELIDDTGQNALLKTLEEPPPQTYIILVTSRPDRLLPTIHSRCQHARFGRLDETAMRAWFDRAGLELAADERDWIEAAADGSPGTALLAAEYGFYAWHRALEPMLEQIERGRFPVEMAETMSGLIEEFAKAWVRDHDNASKDAANKDGAGHLLALLAARARRRLGECCADPGAAARWLEMIDLVREAERQSDRGVNRKMVLENLVAQLARPPAPV
ncbi:MAG: DNA polymerase III subunit [Planctomycetota bacterium]|jgi:DNA polymerase-3 subunit delta'